MAANHLMVNATQCLGSFRYGEVFGEAIRLVAAGRINLAPLPGDVFSLVELPRAMQRCFAKDDVIKVQLQIG